MYWGEFLTIAIAHFFAVASPGPDFAVVTRQCVTSGTRVGIWTSLGVSVAILLHVSYCILGVALLISQSPFYFNLMKYFAAGYLFYLGIKSIVNSFIMGENLGIEKPQPVMNFRKAFILGFLTNGLNPKATLFFLALFTAIVAESTPTLIQVIYGAYLATATFIWFALLSRLFGMPSIRHQLLNAGNWFERGMGIVLIILALQIAFNVN